MLTINKISKRTIVFTMELEDWDLHISVIIGDKYNYIIDTGLGDDHIKEILKYINTKNDNEIIVINSHYHWDHIWGNGACSDSIIVAHELCYEILEERWDQDYANYKEYQVGIVNRVLPTLTFKDSLQFKKDGIVLFHTPGHTKDCICVYDKYDHVLHIIDNIGDNLEDLIPSLEVSMGEYLESLKMMKSYGAKLYTCGHNQVIDNTVFDQLISEVKSKI